MATSRNPLSQLSSTQCSTTNIHRNPEIELHRFLFPRRRKQFAHDTNRPSLAPLQYYLQIRKLIDLPTILTHTHTHTDVDNIGKVIRNNYNITIIPLIGFNTEGASGLLYTWFIFIFSIDKDW